MFAEAPWARVLTSGGAVAALLVACGSSGGGSGGFSSSGGTSSSGGGGASSGSGSSSGASSGAASRSGTSSGATSSGGSSGTGSSGGSSGSSSGAVDAGQPWSGTFSGPLTCSGAGSYKSDFSGTCGVDRWSIKTGTDSAASQINMTPKLTTVDALVALPGLTTSSSTPRQSSEMQAYALKDISIVFMRLEDDGDYHLVLQDNPASTTTMIGEIPYPGCFTGGPLACNISRARATVDANYTLVLDQGHNYNLVASIIGVSFFDFEHGQFGSAANNIELHAVLAICFGKGCDPTKT